MERILESYFPVESHENIHLQCFQHLKDDFIWVLQKTDFDRMTVNQITRQFPGYEIGDERFGGFVDCDTNQEFDEAYAEFIAACPGQFTKWLETKQGRLQNIPDMIKQCMLKPIRTRAHLGNPPNRYTTNSTESMHNLLKEQVGRHVTIFNI